MGELIPSKFDKKRRSHLVLTRNLLNATNFTKSWINSAAATKPASVSWPTTATADPDGTARAPELAPATAATTTAAAAATTTTTAAATTTTTTAAATAGSGFTIAPVRKRTGVARNLVTWVYQFFF